MRLFAEKYLLIARDSLTELIRTLVALVKRQSFQGINAGKCSAHCLGHGTKKIHMRVIHSLVEFACNRMYIHFAVFFCCVISLNNFSPQHAACAEFGNLHEIVGRNTHVEFDTRCHFIGSQPVFCHQCKPLGTPCECIAEFLSDERTCVVKHEAVYRKATETFDLFDNLIKSLPFLSRILGERKTVLEKTAERIVAY